MAVTEIGLSGDYEHFDLTIAKLLEGNWATGGANTSDRTPEIFSATGYNVRKSWPHVNGTGSYQVHCNEIDDIHESDARNLGDTFHKNIKMIGIDIFCTDAEMRKLTQREINRILWDNRPTSGSLVPKSDASDSPIAAFENTELDWIPEENTDADFTSDFEHSSATLNCIYYKRRS